MINIGCVDCLNMFSCEVCLRVMRYTERPDSKPDVDIDFKMMVPYGERISKPTGNGALIQGVNISPEIKINTSGEFLQSDDLLNQIARNILNSATEKFDRDIMRGFRR